MIPELVEWQRIDPENGIVEPWWTWPCMEVIKTWRLKDKIWLEFGAGLSTSWLRNKCCWVDTIESNSEWADRAMAYCIDNGLHNGRIHVFPMADGIPELAPKYISFIPENKYDIISVDGIYRVECIEWAINHFKGRDGVLIIDNLDQDYVFISPKAMDLISPFEQDVFVQHGHTNHEGRPWNTRIVRIPA